MYTSAPAVPQTMSEFITQIGLLWDCGSSFQRAGYYAICKLSSSVTQSKWQPAVIPIRFNCLNYINLLLHICDTRVVFVPLTYQIQKTVNLQGFDEA